ncbi:MAG: GNAT family N-acetyltransferase [Veillonellaceae bacterium]|nr:GNAT family N-acetyltransferase [Veillonellaceae bacterium]
MKFRLGREAEYAAIRRLWDQAFGSEEPWTGWYFSQHYRPERTWVGLERGKIVAQAHLLPHRLMLRGALRRSVYFVGVCVEEKLRGTGIGRDLMASALVELKRTGVAFSILQPRWPEFYRKLGWDYGYSRQRCELPMPEVRRRLPAARPVLDWQADERNCAVMMELYDAFAAGRHGYAARAQTDWKKLLADHRGEGGHVGVLRLEGRPVLYVLYHRRDRILRVRELVWRDPQWVDAVWGPLLAWGEAGGADTLAWDDPAGEPVSVLFPGSRCEPFLMGRLTDVRAALSTIAYPAEVSADLTLRVTDPLAPWNESVFSWVIRQGQGELRPASADAIPGLSLSIGALSQLVFGEYPARRILDPDGAGNCREENLTLMERVFPACRNFISEYF